MTNATQPNWGATVSSREGGGSAEGERGNVAAAVRVLVLPRIALVVVVAIQLVVVVVVITLSMHFNMLAPPLEPPHPSLLPLCGCVGALAMAY